MEVSNIPPHRSSTLFNVKIKVLPSKDTIKETINKCKMLLKILQEADKFTIIAQFKGEDNQEAIISEKDILMSTNKLRK